MIENKKFALSKQDYFSYHLGGLIRSRFGANQFNTLIIRNGMDNQPLPSVCPDNK